MNFSIGFVIKINGNDKQSIEPASGLSGTICEVKNIFFLCVHKKYVATLVNFAQKYKSLNQTI